jgi:hypothetical protein
MNRKVSEEDILTVFVEEMEARGESRKLVRLDVDALMLERINRAKGCNIDLEKLNRFADRCLANEWIEHAAIGVGKYGYLSLTTTGLGIVRSRQRKEEASANRSRLKKASDYIEDHKGLFVALGAAVALAGLLLKLFAR